MTTNDNVTALKAAIEKWAAGNPHGIDIESLAHELARRGVLAPGALTPEQARDVVHASLDLNLSPQFATKLPVVKRDALVSELVRIAKGQA